MELRKNTFKLKLIFSYIFIILISFVLVAFLLNKDLAENSLTNIKSSLLTEAKLIESQITPELLNNEKRQQLYLLVTHLSSRLKGRITIIDLDGKVLVDSEKTLNDVYERENHRNRPEVSFALSGSTGMDMRHSATLKIDMLYVALPIKEKGETFGVLRLAFPLNSIHETLFETRKIVFISLLFAIVFAVLLGSFVGAKIINPISKIIDVSRKFSEGDFSKRIIPSSRDEIAGVSVTLNEMAQDLEEKIQEIKEKNQRISAVFNSMIEGVIVLDKKGNVVSVNSTIERIFSVKKEEVKGKIFIEAIRVNKIDEVINAVLVNGEFLSTEITLHYPVQRIFEVNATAVFDNREIKGCLVVIHDITEMRKLETMRTDFVANVSHELKTPLTAIKGFVETLIDGALYDKENSMNFLKIIQAHAERLNNLINDLLSLSCLESKATILKKDKIGARKFLESILEGFKSHLNKKKIIVINKLPEDLLIIADKEKMEQVFINLIDNAIKFSTEKGSINISSELIDGYIKFIVEDSGAGIPLKDLPRIFERFYRVDKARSAELGGTGLGLSIVKHIIELHGGTVTVESTEGQGSKFCFSLPA